MGEQWRVVVIGGGYAGALAAARLGRDPKVHVTIVAPGGRLVHRVRLYRHLALRPDVRAVYALTSLVGPRVTVCDAWASAVDLAAKRVHTTQGALPYDALVVATGSVGVAPPPPPSTSQETTLVEADETSLARLRARLPQLASSGASVLVVGGGATAVELAGTLASDWPNLRVAMISPEPPLAALGPAAQARSLAQLRRLGVSWRAGRVTQRADRGVRLAQDEEVLADVVVWAPGLVSRAADLLSPALSRAPRADGRVAVLPTLQLPDHHDVYVVGDAAAVDGPLGAVPMGCKTGMPMAAHAADNIRRVMAGAPPRPLAYRDPGASVAIGSGWALGTTGADAGPPRLVSGGRAVSVIKWLLCWYVLASIRWQARGFLSYRWLRGPEVATLIAASGEVQCDAASA